MLYYTILYFYATKFCMCVREKELNENIIKRNNTSEFIWKKDGVWERERERDLYIYIYIYILSLKIAAPSSSIEINEIYTEISYISTFFCTGVTRSWRRPLTTCSCGSAASAPWSLSSASPSSCSSSGNQLQIFSAYKLKLTDNVLIVYK